MNFLWILLIVVVAVEATVLPETVTTVYGKIKGVTETLPSGNQVQFFKGIPFAKPPVGTLRFEKPQPPEPWTTTLNATSFGKQCVQFFLPPFNGATDSEDCLFINIARPTTPSIDPRGYPVMLYLFGGAFVTGSALSGHNAYANDALVTKGVILASINYRLGPLGYYSSRDSSAPGNYALWDIIQALQFIQDVIPQFGGDKNRVTLFGVSAGGVQTSWITYSEASAGLLNQAMPMCGNAHTTSANSINNDISSAQFEVLAGCDQVANKKECLKALSIEQLVNISAPISSIGYDTLDITFWGPRFDGDFVHADGLTAALLTAPNVTTLVTMNSNEDISFSINSRGFSPNAIYFPIQPSEAPDFNQTDFQNGISYLLNQRGAYGAKASEVIQKVINFYELQKNKFTHNQYLQAYTQFLSDLNFAVSLTREAKLKTSAHRRTFVYVHDFVPPQNANPYYDGAAHCTDSAYITSSINETDPTTKKIKKLIVDFVVNFAKCGFPRSDFTFIPPVLSPNYVNYFYLGGTQQSVQISPFSDVTNFWEGIANDYGFDWITGRITGSGA